MEDTAPSIPTLQILRERPDGLRGVQRDDTHGGYIEQVKRLHRMVDYAQARQAMVDSQLRTSAVTDRRVLDAMGLVPRERFVPEARQSVAYIDDSHTFGAARSGRFIPAPALLARLLQLAEIAPDDRILDVGATSGYGTAVMAELGHEVVGIETDARLVETARSNLSALGIGNATVIEGAHTRAPEGRFEVIVLEGAVDKVPEGLLTALDEGGRLVCMVRSGAVAVAHIYIRSGRSVTSRAEFNASLPMFETLVEDETFVF